MSTAKISLVTGATGQLGSHIVEQLRLGGETVRVLVRAGRDLAFLQSQGVEIVEGDLHDPEAVKRAADGATIVYNAAAKVSDWGPWSEFEKEAVTSTTNVVNACKSAGVQRLLHVSSISVYGHPSVGPDERITEATPLGQNFWMWDYYPQAKLISENIVRDYADATIVRPSWLYGPRDRITIPRVIPALLAQRAPIIGDGQNYLNIIYAGDVAAGIILAANHPDAKGQAYNICSEGEVKQVDLLNALTDALSLPRVTSHVPYWLALQWAFLNELWKTIIFSSSPPTITRRAVYLIGRSTQYSTQKARTQLGWKPQVNIIEGIRRTLEWFVSLPENKHIQIKAPVLESTAPLATGKEA
ncbi:MAG: NAD-dependent epimerase/dehydratase family protein [Planctomycetes bacterium]|nr:NAD-dependent epimerase/dehydratase family protein [Planctomycetota bacterium]